MTKLRSALWLPISDDLADPAVVARLAAEAEEAGWHGVFVWDNLRWQAPVRRVADPWITPAAIATATERLRLGPMDTPCPPPATQGRQGNRDAGPAQRWPPHPRCRSRQRPLRRRAARDRRGTRRFYIRRRIASGPSLSTRPDSVHAAASSQTGGMHRPRPDGCARRRPSAPEYRRVVRRAAPWPIGHKPLWAPTEFQRKGHNRTAGSRRSRPAEERLWIIPAIVCHDGAFVLMRRIAREVPPSSVRLQRPAVPLVMIGDLVLAITPLLAGQPAQSGLATETGIHEHPLRIATDVFLGARTPQRNRRTAGCDELEPGEETRELPRLRRSPGAANQGSSGRTCQKRPAGHRSH